MVLFTIIIMLMGCAGSQNNNLKRRSLNKYYLSNGNKDYKLPLLPYWANFSTAGECRLDKNVTYFDLNALRNSFNLNFEQAIQTQLMYNDEHFRNENKKSIDNLSLESEDKIFLEVNQKIQQGLRTFKVPRYKKISVIWVDHFLKKRGELKKILERNQVKEGYPVLLSFCYSRLSLENFLREDGLDRLSVRLISNEMMSPYTPNKQFAYDYNVYLNELFSNNYKITLFSKRGMKIPSQIKGKFKKKYL